MATGVKGGRVNQSRGSQARTRLARRAVVDAARVLFLERGYQATTIDAISDYSDVPAATVYRLFSSKLGILNALLDVSIAGDDQTLSIQERPQITALFAEPDPAKLLAGFATITVAINARSSDVYRILISAAASDPAATELLANYQQQRDRGQSRIAHSLARTRALRPGLRRTRRRRPHPRTDVPRALPATRHRPRLATATLRTVAHPNPHRPTDLPDRQPTSTQQ